jgi:hypothetical protein
VVIHGPAEIIETVGPEVIVHVRFGDELVIGKLGARRIPTFGEPVQLAMDCNAMHLFDKESQQRLGAG